MASELDGDMMAEFGAVEKTIITNTAASDGDSESDDGASSPGIKRKRNLLKKGKASAKSGGRLKKKRKKDSSSRDELDDDDRPSGPIVARPKSSRQRPLHSEAAGKVASAPAPRQDDGDEYDSEEDVQETAEDKDFIDRTGDDQELLREYDEQDQRFRDERPDGKKKKKKKGAHDYGDDEAIEERPGGKVSRSQKKEQEQRQREEDSAQLLIEMQIAAEQDDKAVRAKTPALARISLLARARSLILNRSCHQALLDGPQSGHMQGVSILHLLRRWLKPRVANKKLLLPPLQLRTAVYGFLEALPLDASRMRESKLGEVMAAYLVHPTESVANRRRLRALTDRVSRSILGKSVGFSGGTAERLRAEAEAYEAAGVVGHATSYVSAQAAGAGADGGKPVGGAGLPRRKKVQGAGAAALGGAGAGGLGILGGDPDGSATAAPTEGAGFRARLPQAMPLTFMQNVQSSFQSSKLGSRAGALAGVGGSAGAAPSAKQQMLRRRMREMKGAAKAKGSRAEHMSIVGRELG